MKRMKKLVGLLLTMVMVLSMTMTAFAAKDTQHTITITNETTNHTYEAYQVFVGNITGGKLTDFDWGTGVDSVELLAELKNNTAYSACTSAEDVAKVLEGFSNDSENLDAFARIVAKHLGTVAGTSVATQSPYVINVTGDGYYFIKDKDNSVTAEKDSYTEFILKVVENVTVAAKDGTVESEKKVQDKNDSTGTTSEWQDSADYDIGDDVPFQLTAKLPANFTSYTTYKLTFHDKESTGLTFNNDVKVYIDDVEIESGFEVKTNLNDGCTFEVHFEQLVGTAAKDNSVIKVTYSSKLNEGAVIGEEGNPNTMKVTYSNNPNDTQGGENGKTPDDTVIVFTYETIINKVTKGENDSLVPLKGAEFKLEKEMADGTWKAVTVVKNNEGTVFTFTGLDDGLYRLTETVTPAGYNSIDPIYFEVKATHDEEADNPELKELVVVQKKETEDGFVDLESGKITFTPTVSKEAGTITADVVNQAGATLPETGGMGTTLFYVFGTILVVGAAVMLITKKRMSGVR